MIFWCALISQHLRFIAGSNCLIAQQTAVIQRRGQRSVLKRGVGGGDPVKDGQIILVFYFHLTKKKRFGVICANCILYTWRWVRMRITNRPPAEKDRLLV